MPLIGFVPLHPPEAVHEVALVEDQVTVEVLPDVMLVGLAEIVTAGGVVPVSLAENADIAYCAAGPPLKPRPGLPLVKVLSVAEATCTPLTNAVITLPLMLALRTSPG